jgi:hypothetical protein
VSLSANTGRTAMRPCARCGLVVEFREWSIFGDVDGPHWSATKHTAPCGLPCMGGGVGSEVIKPMRAAGKTLRDVTHGETCTACGAMTLDQSLAALERTDPAVAAASRKYDETFATFNARMKAEVNAMAAVCAAAEAWRDLATVGNRINLETAVDALRAARKARP